MEEKGKIHLIAIGGAVMHNLALALQEAGYQVTGSDDEIFEPSLNRLAMAGLLPEHMGWFPERITADLDRVILGMHARSDNPELLEATRIGLPVMSFPEFIYSVSAGAVRIAICGSHGKTTITSMLMHGLRAAASHFDYLVGAQLEGFQTMVRLSQAPLMIIEGDEYHASPLLPEPKFLFYKAQILLISGIAWDHFNVFPTFDDYLMTFRKLLRQMQPADKLVANAEDEVLVRLVQEEVAPRQVIWYTPFRYHTDVSGTTIEYDGTSYPISVFGKHNISNLSGAATLAGLAGIDTSSFLGHLSDFTGAARRMEKAYERKGKTVFRDFAHAPSKVKATTSAIREMYPTQRITACLELHTFSSLNKGFLPQYAHALDAADIRVVFYDPHTLEMKKLPPVSKEEVQDFFQDPGLLVCNDLQEMTRHLQASSFDILLLMSSGHFAGLNIDGLV